MEISSIINAFLTMKMLQSSHSLATSEYDQAYALIESEVAFLPKYILRTDIFSLVSKRICIFLPISSPRFLRYSYEMPIINFPGDQTWCIDNNICSQD